MSLQLAQLRVVRGGFALDLSLSLARGELVAVMGPSGAGKSTLLEAIAGFVPLAAGTVRIGEREVTASDRRPDPARRGAVMLAQDPLLFPHLSVIENVAFGLRARRVPQALEHARVWLQRVGLAEHAERRPAQLSGGQQQRVALARALAIEPEVLLLDEPFTALDPVTADEVREVLAREVRVSGTTVVLVTHTITDALVLAGRLVVIEAGAITQQGAVEEVLASPASPFVAALAGEAGWWRQRVMPPVRPPAGSPDRRARDERGRAR